MKNSLEEVKGGAVAIIGSNEAHGFNACIFEAKQAIEKLIK